MYPEPSHWPNTLWSIGAAVFGAALVGQVVLSAFIVRDQHWGELRGIVGSTFGAAMLLLLCVDRTTWTPSWLTRFLDRSLRRPPRTSD